jgi:hypothetical protein
MDRVRWQASLDDRPKIDLVVDNGLCPAERAVACRFVDGLGASVIKSGGGRISCAGSAVLGILLIRSQSLPGIRARLFASRQGCRSSELRQTLDRKPKPLLLSSVFSVSTGQSGANGVGQRALRRSFGTLISLSQLSQHRFWVNRSMSSCARALPSAPSCLRRCSMANTDAATAA